MLESLNKIISQANESASASDIAADAPWTTQPYSIKRDGLTLTNCDDEPVRTPGCIQAHGALLVLRLADLSILQASENTLAILGYDAAALLGQSVAVIVKPEGQARLRNVLATEPTDCNPIYAFSLPASGQVAEMDVTVHTIDGVVMLEFEATGRSPAAKVITDAAPTEDPACKPRKRCKPFARRWPMRRVCCQAWTGS